MNSIIIILCGGLVGLLFAAGLLLFGKKNAAASARGIKVLEEAAEKRKALLASFKSLTSGMVPTSEIAAEVIVIRRSREQLKTERGRMTITQAELETVESRLRELEEIERELEASGVETKEEYKILKSKAEEIKQQSDSLRMQIQSSDEQVDMLLEELKNNAVATEQVQQMRIQLAECQQKIDLVLLELEQASELYIEMKSRYDALDIEYAQLYEKFSAME